MGFVAGIGKTNVDLLYANMNKLPDVGEEVYTDDFSVALGGGLPGTLVNLSRLGVPVRLATYLGTDMFSVFAEREFRKNNVNILNLHSGGKIPVNITSAVILPEDRSFISYGTEKTAFTEQEKAAFYDMAKGCTICYMESEALYDVYSQLKKDGALLVYDTGWDDNMSLTNYQKMLTLADYYFPNQKEAMKLTGTASPADAAKALTDYLEHVVVKMDKDGCLAVDTDGTTVTVPAIDSFRHVDSTGAGDAFLAGFLYGLYHHYSFTDCLLLGNITGGKAVTAVGALSAYCNEEELLRLFKANRKSI